MNQCLNEVYSNVPGAKNFAAASHDMTLPALQYMIAHHTREEDLLLILVGRCMAVDEAGVSWLLSQPRVPSRIGPEALVAAAAIGSFQMTDWLIENTCGVVVCGVQVGYMTLYQSEALTAAISHHQFDLVSHMVCFHRAPLVHRHGRQAAAMGCLHCLPDWQQLHVRLDEFV